MMPKFSICIAVYNTEKYIKECIESVLNQTYTDFEIIIVDDGSKDNSGLICDEYAKKDSRIKVFHNNTNLGPLATKCIAFSNTSGQYVMNLDSDDTYESNALEIVNKTIEKYDPDMVIFGLRRTEDGIEVGRIQEKQKIKIYDKTNRNEFILKIALTSYYNSICTKATKGEIVRNLKISTDDYNLKRGDDKYISAHIYKHVVKITFIDSVLYNYRTIETGITVRQNKQLYDIDFRNKEKIKDLVYEGGNLSNNEIEQFDEFSLRQFKSQLIQIGNIESDMKTKIKKYLEIKKSSYYQEYLCKLDNRINSIEVLLFEHGLFYLLIIESVLKKYIKHIIK